MKCKKVQLKYASTFESAWLNNSSRDIVLDLILCAPSVTKCILKHVQQRILETEAQSVRTIVPLLFYSAFYWITFSMRDLKYWPTELIFWTIPMLYLCRLHLVFVWVLGYQLLAVCFHTAWWWKSTPTADMWPTELLFWSEDKYSIEKTQLNLLHAVLVSLSSFTVHLQFSHTV